jgi:hypothetical protein
VASKERKPSNKLRYFYLNGKLHKVMKISRGADLVTAWCYVDERRYSYVWSDAQKRLEYAFTVKQAGELFGKHKHVIERLLREGHIRRPQFSYNLQTKRIDRLFFSESDMLEIHDYFLGVHIGRPRKDGLINVGNLPNREELKALMRKKTMLYVQGPGGEFVPVYKENPW